MSGRLPGALWRRSRLSEPEVYDVLRNERRRRTVRYLRDWGGEVDLEELAAAIARLECDGQPSGSDVRSVYNSLHQRHLPRLETSDIVAYDEEAKVVTLAGNAGDVDRYLQLRSVYGFSWVEYYQVLAVVSLLGVLLVELDLAVLAALETVPVVTLALAVLALSVSYQLWTRRWIYVRSLLS